MKFVDDFHATFHMLETHPYIGIFKMVTKLYVIVARNYVNDNLQITNWMSYMKLKLKESPCEKTFLASSKLIPLCFSIPTVVRVL